jgi:hypothetical protein
MASALDELSLQASSSLDVPLPDSMRAAAIRFAAILGTPREPQMPRLPAKSRKSSTPGSVPPILPVSAIMPE